MSRATTSLPTPLSPVMRTLASHRDAYVISSSRARMAVVSPRSEWSSIGRVRNPRLDRLGHEMSSGRETKGAISNSVNTLQERETDTHIGYIHPHDFTACAGSHNALMLGSADFSSSAIGLLARRSRVWRLSPGT